MGRSGVEDGTDTGEEIVLSNIGTSKEEFFKNGFLTCGLIGFMVQVLSTIQYCAVRFDNSRNSYVS